MWVSVCCQLRWQRASDVQSMNADCMTVLVQQADVNDKMRAILIDWLVEVHLKFKVGRPENMFSMDPCRNSVCPGLTDKPLNFSGSPS